MATTRRPQASILVRLSRQADERNLSLAGMESDCRDLAERLGADVAHVRIDDGLSGAIRDRPEFLKWLHDGESGGVDLLIPYSVDRISREGANALARLLDCVEGKDSLTGKVVRRPVRLVDTEGIDSEQEGWRLRFVLAGEIARAELQRIKKRNVATQRRLREQGRHGGGATPYGCKIVTRSGRDGFYLATNKAEADVLIEAAQRLLVPGASIRSVVTWLNASGHRTRGGREWSRASLRVTMLSKATADHVLSPALRRAVAERLKTNPEERPKGGRPATYLLGRWALCGGCRGKLTVSRGKYVCASIREGRTCKSGISIDAAEVDKHLADEYLRLFGDIEEMDVRVVLVGGDRLDAAEEALSAARVALDAPGADVATFEAYKAAQAELAAAKAEPVQRDTQLVLTGRTYGDAWRAADSDGRAGLLAGAMTGPPVIHPGRAIGRKVDLSRVKWEWDV